MTNTLLIQGLDHSGTSALLGLLAVLFLFGSLWNMNQSKFKGYWASLAFLSPVLVLALAYILVTALRIHWEWSVASLILGVIYMLVLQRQQKYSPSPQLVATLIISAHLAYSLAVVMFLREATLTLALALQSITLVWLERKYALPVLIYATKVLLAIVIARLTLNPWLLSYPTDFHWSLWVCGGACAATFVASKLASERNKLAQWLQGATLHLLALTLIFETRYQLYDGNIFSHTYSFTEAAINTAIWGLIGNVYLFRARAAENMQKFYQACAYLLLAAAAINYGLALIIMNNPLWTSATPGQTPIFNILLLAYGLPVMLCALTYFLIDQKARKLVASLGIFSLLYFVTIEIRHLWQADLNILAPSSDGEQYTYSMIWLLLAISGTVLGIRFERHTLYKGAMIFLLVVIGKVFIFDMAGLTSLWRVGSFMGLGLCLLGLAYFHQLIRTRAQAVKEIQTK